MARNGFRYHMEWQILLALVVPTVTLSRSVQLNNKCTIQCKDEIRMFIFW